MGYFTVEVKPDIDVVAAGQHAAFGDGDVLFDWASFSVPNSGGRLVGASVEIRPKGDSGATPNKFPLELLFARQNVNHPDRTKQSLPPTTLGPANSAPAHSGDISLTVNKFLGSVPILAADFADSIDPLAVASTGSINGIVLQQHPDYNRHFKSESNDITPGFSKFFIAGIAKGNFNFVSSTLINNGDLDGPTMTTSGTDPRLFIAPGDTVAVTTTANTAITKAMGVVASLGATSIVLTEAFTTADVVHEDIVYNKNPLRILLVFKR